ncbi:MAG: histidinol dehydrogenase [Solirubrobacterales bacterium]
MRITRIDWDGADPAGLAARLRPDAAAGTSVTTDVAEIVAAVRDGGDRAVLELGERFDGVRPQSLRIPVAEIQSAAATLDPSFREALRVAATNIRLVAESQLAAEPVAVELPQGHTVAIREIPVGSAGIYVPGGGAALASSALMCAIPARVAGVGRIALASPPGLEGHVSAAVLAACDEAGVDEVYAMGGAQAIAALGLGTETVQPVDLVAGPGNPYTQEAKRQLYGQVGIDGIAGPSELMVILGEGARVEWAAFDLCAQAEHGAGTPLVAAAVEMRVLDTLAERVVELAGSRPSVAVAALALVAVPDTDSALALANAFAPEHLQIATEDAEIQAGSVMTAGCVFIGEVSGTAFGDYAAGSNHVLPTGGAGRFQGPLGPGAFRRRIANVSLPRAAAEALAPHTDALARAEGLPVHGESGTERR